MPFDEDMYEEGRQLTREHFDTLFDSTREVFLRNSFVVGSPLSPRDGRVYRLDTLINFDMEKWLTLATHACHTGFGLFIAYHRRGE